MIIVRNGQIVGNTAPNIYGDLKPWQHASGVFRWTCSNVDGYYELPEITDLAQRTQAELEAMPEWIAWNRQQEILDDAINAPAAFQALPHWLKTFTITDIDAYVETNVTNLATAKTALAHLGKAVIIMRDYLKLRV